MASIIFLIDVDASAGALRPQREAYFETRTRPLREARIENRLDAWPVVVA